MAAASTPSADQTADLMENLKLDSQSKDHDADEAAKPALGQCNSSNGAEAANSSVPPREPTLTPLLQEMSQMMDPANVTYMPTAYPSSCFLGYGDVDKYFNQVGGEIPSGVYGRDLYGQRYGYAPYGTNPTPDSRVPTMGSDGQLDGTQHYQHLTQYYQPPTPNASYASHQDPIRGSVSTVAAANQASLSTNLVKATPDGTSKVNVNGNSGSSPLKQSHQNRPSMSNSAYLKGGVPGGLSASGYQDFRYGYDTMQSPVSWSDGTLLSTGQQRPSTTASAFPHNVSNSSARNQNQQPLPHFMGLHTQRPLPGMMGSTSPGFSSKLYPSSIYYGYGSDLEKYLNQEGGEMPYPALGQYSSNNCAEASNASVPPREPTLTKGFPSSCYYGYGGDRDKYLNQEGGEMPSPALGQYSSNNGAEAANASVPLLQRRSQIMYPANMMPMPDVYPSPCDDDYDSDWDEDLNQEGVEMTSVSYHWSDLDFGIDSDFDIDFD